MVRVLAGTLVVAVSAISEISAPSFKRRFQLASLANVRDGLGCWCTERGHRQGLISTLSRNFYVRTCIKFTFANKIEEIYERSNASVKVETRTNSRLISTIYILPLLYLREFTCVKVRSQEPVSRNSPKVKKLC